MSPSESFATSLPVHFLQGGARKKPLARDRKGQETNTSKAEAYWKLAALTSGLVPPVTVMKAPMKPGAFRKSLVRPS